MPSNNDPKSSVNSGPGKLPTGVVPSSALLFPSSGGSGAALEAHILNPTDAHFAGAIGIPPVDPTNGDPLLASAGGPINGESVLDFIDQFKDLLPTPPNYLGAATVVNTGLPNWGNLATTRTGAFTRGSAVQPSHYLLANGTSNFTVSTASNGALYPADRGVLALYKNTDGLFASGTTTLVAALWLGPSPSPAGVPSANWDPALKSSLQPNYTASGSGLDLISLSFRYPVQINYGIAPWTGSPYANYPLTFSSFQIAQFAIAAQTLSALDTGSFLLVQWRETYATTLASIQGSALLANLTAANCYSIVPGGTVASGVFDYGSPATINRRNVFVDSGSGTAPSGSTFTSSPNSLGTIYLSGVQHYSSLTFNVTIDANHLFTDSYDTSAVLAELPTNYQSASQAFTTTDPLQIGFGNFGAGTTSISYINLHPGPGAHPNYSPTNPPGTSDVGEYTNTSLAIPSPPSFTLLNGSAPWNGALSSLTSTLNNPFHSTGYNDTSVYIYNSWPQSGGGVGSTTTFDQMTDEQYRYISSIVPTSSSPVLPAGGNKFASSTVLASPGSDLQVVGGSLVYPQTNYSTAHPVAQPNYSTFPSSDGALNLRRYVRAFDTGSPRNTGHLTISGLSIPTGTNIPPFQTNAAFNGSETTGHTWTNVSNSYITGGIIIQIMVPGVTGWLDAGRAATDPVTGGAANYDGCATNYSYSGSNTIIAYNTTSQTANNGSGQFPIFVRITIINGVNNGSVLSIQHAIQSITWAP